MEQNFIGMINESVLFEGRMKMKRCYNNTVTVGGHVTYMREKKNICTFFVGKREVKSPLEISWRRCEVSIKIYLKETVLGRCGLD
jgi:hypothetical protein